MSARSRLEPPLKPRNGRTLKVLGIARISGGPNQTEKSNEDQEALYRSWLANRLETPFNLTMIAGKGSGERLDREELEEAQAAIESGEFDLLISEDLGRIMRRVHAYLFCEAAEDAGTRVIAINDNVDMARDDWRLSAFFASMRHELYNADTGKRIRRTQRNRFANGGMLPIALFCYYKPPGCKSDADLQKIANMESIVLGVVDRLERGWTYSRIADWLNESKIPVGPGCRRKTWDGAMVRRIVFNPILKGLRIRNAKRSVRINKTGRRKQVNASPEEWLQRHVPHLAFIEPDRYDRLIARLTEQGERYSVPKRRGSDPRKGRPKKRTRWPGQHVYCQLCGKMYVYGGHGKRAHLMCSGAREYGCWNGVTFDAGLAARRIAEAVFEMLSGLPEFEPVLLQALQDEALLHQQQQSQKLQQVTRELGEKAREEQRLVAAVKKDDGLDVLIAALKEVQAQRKGLEFELRQLQEHQPPPIELPKIDQIRQDVRQAMEGLALESQEFGDCMRQIIEKIVVYPVELCDGRSDPVLRARFTVDFGSHLAREYQLPAIQQQLRREVIVDLFEMPQRAAYRERVMALRNQGMTEREVAKVLGLTLTATQRAAALDRLMEARGLTDPYVLVTAPIERNRRYRRHRHPRYRNQTGGSNDAA